VIIIGLAFGLVAGRHHPQPARLALLAGLLAGNQYAAGALNDAVDADLDAAAGRGKPIERGVISRRAVTALALVAGLGSLVCGALLGPVTFALAAAGLACAFAYDLWLKGTPASVVPFALALPLIPLFGYGAAGRFPAVLWWAWPIGALAAVAVNLADALPDLESDQAADVNGLAPRLGLRRAATVCAAGYTLAVAVALASALRASTTSHDRLVAGSGAALAAVLGAAALTAGTRGEPGPQTGTGAGHRAAHDGRRVAYRLLLGGLIAVALGWVVAIRP